MGKLTVVTTTKPATLGKTYKLTASGIEKTTAGQMVEGSYQVRDFTDAHSLAELLAGIGTDQALVASLPKSETGAGGIVTKAAKANHPGALSRTKGDFAFPAGQPGVLILDYDPHGEAMTRDALWQLLQSMGVAGCGVVWWSSGSSFIFHGDTEISGLRGQRFYLMVTDLSDTVRVGEVLAKRLWLAGMGRVEISASGQRLTRSVFDAAMFEVARLDFIGGAVCESPLSQRRGSPMVLGDGGGLDTRTAFPELTADELARYEALIEDAKLKAEPEARQVREAWKAARMESEVGRLVASGVAPEIAAERADRTLSAALGGVLLGDFQLTLDGGEVVTVGEVLDMREKYHGVLTLDPLEPEYLGGKIVGKLFLYGARATLHSFAHGGATYQLRRQPARLYVQRGAKAGLVDELRELLRGESDLFIRGGLLVRVEDGRVRALRKHALTHFLQSRVALYSKDRHGKDFPADLPMDVVDMLIAVTEGA
jgi:hypothetical protein